MKQSKRTDSIRNVLGLAAGLALAMMEVNFAHAYDRYSDGCNDCHGNFRGSTSTKGTVFPSNNNHEMHRASSSMAIACDLCHIGSSRTPVYIGSSTGTANNPGLGCTGCYVAAGLRAHHAVNGVSDCANCHDPETSAPENVNPPYYGRADSKVKNAGNTVRAANTNENWSVGDFLGLDNDGNNLYDLADYAIGPFHIASAIPEGNNLRITWHTAGGRTDAVQAAGKPSGPYTNLSSAVAIPGVGLVTTNYLEVGGASKGARFYRLRSQVP